MTREWVEHRKVELSKKAGIEDGTCGVSEIDNKIEIMHEHNLHKLRLMPHFEP